MSDSMMALMTFLAAVSAGICFIGFLEALQMINQALPQ